MGIVVLTVALFPLIGIGGNTLMAAESPGPELNRITPKISTMAKIFWLLYTGLTLLEILLLYVAGMDVFDAITHAFATMATGGFSTKNASIAAFPSPLIQWIITVFMFLAGTNFALFFAFITRDFMQIVHDTEFRWYAGASAGSTGGGIKVVRIITALKALLKELTHFFIPLKIGSIKINRRHIENYQIRAVLIFIVSYGMLVLLTTIVVSLQGIDVLSSLSTALATL
ncbi:trk system potassium uptake protein TrkH-like, partial [Ylistrum balloti]|uniref:trk system potassium uptake protein TrkH-like n=1 Tax=Ylistrum balloti TaxID=509963 RepID=UPI002905AC99